MNGLDYAIIVVVSIGALWGLSQGALRMITSVVSLIGGLYFASLYYHSAGAIAEKQLGTDPILGAVVGYVVLFALVFVAIELAGTMVMKLLHVVHLGGADRLAGGALGGAIAGVVMGLLVMMMAAVLPADAEILRQSQLAPRLLVYNQALVHYIPEQIKIAYLEKRALLVRYWIESEARLAQQAASPQASATAGTSK